MYIRETHKDQVGGRAEEHHLCPLLMWLMSVDPKQCSTGCCCEVLAVSGSLKDAPNNEVLKCGR